MRLSVCCLTSAPPQRTEARLAPIRGRVAEVVVGCPIGAAGRYAAVADRVVELESLDPEAAFARLGAVASSEWLLRLSDLELPSASLAGRLPELLGDARVGRYALPRRWLAPTGDGWLDEVPWWPDFQVRLVRRDEGAASAGAVVHVDAPLYNLDAALNRRSDRQAEAVVLDARSPGMRAPGGKPLTAMFEPERYAERVPAPVPDDDRAAIGAVLAEAGGRTVAPGAASALPADPGAGAPLEAMERDRRFFPSERRPVAVTVRNGTDRRWPEAHLVAVWASGEAASRAPLPLELVPGASCVVPLELVAPGAAGPARLEVARAGVAEPPAPLRLELSVRPPRSAPDRREVRPLAARRRRLWPPRRPGSPIPRILHRVWLGSRPIPEEHRAFEAGWARLHPGWRSRLWTDADAPAPAGVERARNVAERADLVRYEVLRRHGGVYADTDVEWLRPLDELLAGVEAFAAYEVPGRLCNAVLGAVPGHPAFTRAVELAERTVGTGVYPSATATDFLTGVLERDPTVTLFGPERFYPYLWDEEQRPATEFPQAYAVHRWAKSWVEAPGPGR